VRKMFKIFHILVLEMKLFVRNFFTVVLLSAIGVGFLLLSVSLSRIVPALSADILSLGLWLAILFTTLLSLFPVIARDCQYGLVQQYALAGVDCFEYLLEKLFVALLRLLLPVAVYSFLIFYLLEIDAGQFWLLFILALLHAFALSELIIWLGSLTGEFSNHVFFLLFLPFLLPHLLSARYLFRLVFEPSGAYPWAWFYWLLSYLIILFAGLWLVGEFFWEEF